MDSIESDNLACVAQEVDRICSTFLLPRRFSYFQFKRVYQSDSFVILANHVSFFDDFLENDFTELFQRIPFDTRQSTIYFWDELLSATKPFLTRHEGIYHGITFISRRKTFYDCTSFTMSQRHPTPFSYYFNSLREIQKFVEVFPTLARSLIEKAIQSPKKNSKTSQPLRRKKLLFLPKRSRRFHIGSGEKDYITTYEAFCLQLLQEGKSYKEIASILSMSKSTVETHLTRLKTRTGLTLQELSLQPFGSAHNNSKKVISLKTGFKKVLTFL